MLVTHSFDINGYPSAFIIPWGPIAKVASFSAKSGLSYTLLEIIIIIQFDIPYALLSFSLFEEQTSGTCMGNYIATDGLFRIFDKLEVRWDI